MEIIYKLEDFSNPGDRDLYNGIQEINKTNYQKALEYFEMSSKYDNEYGSLFVAIFYFSGFGLTERDPPKALKLFKMVASTWNNRVAQYLIGVMYWEGDTDVPMEKKTGAQWLTLAADNGWFDAMTYVAIHHFRKGYVGDRLKSAIAWLEKVANHDTTDDELIDNGTLYLFGNKDFELSMAHMKPEVMSILNSGDKYKLISPIKDMKLGQDTIMYDSEECRAASLWDLLSNKKSSGVSTAQMILSRIYNSEVMLLKDVDKAVYWAKRSAKNMGEESLLWLALHYLDVIEPDYKEAAKWLEKAYYSMNVAHTSLLLAFLYLFGEGVQKNSSTALRLFKEYISYDGESKGGAHLSMGIIYLSGEDGVPQDYQKARECFLKAYELGDSDGAAELGVIYFYGLGVERDIDTAFAWLQKAESMGSPLAKRIIKLLPRLLTFVWEVNE